MSTLIHQETQAILDKIQAAQTTGVYFAPTMQEVEVWFRYLVVPRRTAGQGMNTHRIYRGPIGIFLGNTPNPNGLCGDAALFVEQEFRTAFLHGSQTGQAWRRILWQASPWNHTANILVPSSGYGLLRYESWHFDVPLYQKGELPYDIVKHWTVFDLYYKQIYTIHRWWHARGAPLAGAIEIGMEAEVGYGVPLEVAALVPSKIPPRWYHTVVSGEWLSKLAIKYYNDVLKWPIIYDANKGKIGNDPNKLKPNQILAIPDLASLTASEIADVQRRAKAWKSPQ